MRGLRVAVLALVMTGAAIEIARASQTARMDLGSDDELASLCICDMAPDNVGIVFVDGTVIEQFGPFRTD